MSIQSSPVRFFLLSLTVIGIFSPLVVSAQSITDAPSLFTAFLNIVNNIIVPVVFALAFAAFIFGVYRYFIAGGASEEKVAEGQKFVMWSVAGFVLMFSLWGIVNLFTNTLGFSSSVRPALPTFGSVTNTTGTVNPSNGIFPSGTTGSNSIFSGISGFFGGATSPTTLTPGQTITSNGVNYTATGANTVAPVNGSCPSGYSQSGSQCVSGGTNASNGVAGNGSGPSAISGIPNGSSCAISTSNPDGNCEGSLICSNGTCQPDPQAENGDGTLNSTCVPPGDCDGSMICDTNSDTCQNPDTAGVSDGSGAKSNGDGSLGSQCVPPGDCDGDTVCDVNSDTCENPNTTGVSDGGLDGGTPADGSVGQGGSCAGNENACASGTCDADGICADENSGSNTSGGVQQCDYGTVSGGGNCILCSDGSTTADAPADCPSGGGYTGSQEDTGSGASDGSGDNGGG